MECQRLLYTRRGENLRSVMNGVMNLQMFIVGGKICLHLSCILETFIDFYRTATMNYRDIGCLQCQTSKYCKIDGMHLVFSFRQTALGILTSSVRTHVYELVLQFGSSWIRYYEMNTPKEEIYLIGNEKANHRQSSRDFDFSNVDWREEITPTRTIPRQAVWHNVARLSSQRHKSLR